MSTVRSIDAHAWASFRSRFRAFIIDGFICLGIFLVGGLAAAVLFEEHPVGRVASFFLIVACIMSYEPLMLSGYGATFGHRALNIRIVQKDTGENLPVWRAYVRSFVKMFLGSFSFIFMFVTKRAQALHDLAAGSEVRVRDPEHASPQDYFIPSASIDRGSRVSPGIRLVGILVYNILFLVVLVISAALLTSQACRESTVCSRADVLMRTLMSDLWIIAIAFSIVLGWTGRLPGFRRPR